MKSTPSCSPHQRTLVSIAVALALSQYTAALAAPVGHKVVAGQVTVTRPDVLQTVITQASQGAIVNWQSFSVGATERVDIRQPNASSVLLNRVIGNNPSEIYGRLSANGKVFLVNPNGVLFGRNAQVSVGALVASTLDIANDDFLAGRFHFAGNSTAAVDNQGHVQAAERGTVALLGGRVNNDGTISAQLGTAALVAGDKIALDFEGDGLTKIRVDQGAVAAMVANRGMIIADGGQAVLSATAAQALADTVLNQQGVVRARSLVERDGKIVLDGGAHGVTLNAGTLDATGAKTLKGGTVNVLGHHVGLVGNALIDASGDAGGGHIFVGGGVQGGDPLLRHAAATFAGGQATLRADALTHGDGGTVVLWSDGATRMLGAASATGGAQGGDGGFIETSGKFLDVAGVRIDGAAKRGKGGTWLLDPYNLTVIGFNSASGVSAGPDFVSTAPSSTIWNQIITDVLNAGTSVSLTTGAGGTESGDINVSANIIKTAGGDAMLTLNAARDITIGGQVQIGSTAGRLDVDFNADSDGLNGGAILMRNSSGIATNGGNVRFYGQGNPTGGFATGSSLSNPHGIFLDGANINTTAAAGSGGGSISLRGQGALFSVNDGNMLLSMGAGISTSAGALTSGSGAITLTGIGGQGGSGVDASSTAFLTNAGGAIDIRGRGGVPMNDATFGNAFGFGVVTANATFATGGGPGALSLSGESIGNNGLLLRSTIGNASMTGDITLRALNSAADTSVRPMLSTSGPLATSGTLNLLPGGVALNGDLAAAPAVTIEVDSPAPPSDAFTVNLGALGSAIQPGLQTLVIGSASHTGAIRLSALSPLNPAFDITLQNGGAGSLGIALGSSVTMPGRLLTLSSGGVVTQAGPIVADGVLLHGTQAGSSFVLSNASNAVNTVSATFEVAKGSGALDGSVSFANSTALQIGPLSSFGFDSASNVRQALGGATTTVAGNLFVSSTGNLTVAQPVSMLGSDASLTLQSGNDLLINSALTMNGSATMASLTATRDMTANTAITMGGLNSDLVMSAGRNLTLGSSVNLSGADSTISLAAGTTLTTLGPIAMSGANALLDADSNGSMIISGAVTLSGANANMQLDTVTGDITVSAPVSLTANGDQARFIAGRSLFLNAALSTSGADSTVSLAAGTNLTTLGPIAMSGANSVLDANSNGSMLVSGAVALSGTDADMRLQTVTGDISVSAPVSLTASGGEVRFNAGRSLNLNDSLSTSGANTIMSLAAGTTLTALGPIAMSGSNALLDTNVNGNLLISGAVTMSGTNADMWLQTVTGDISVSGPVSLTASGRRLRFSAGRDVLLSGDVSAVGGPEAASVNANRDIVLSAGSRFFTGTAAGPLHLYFNADADNLNGGAIEIGAGASIVTNGGVLRLYGQSNPFGGYASGSQQSRPNGILVSNATINTGTGGTIMYGQGTTFAATGPIPFFVGDGVALNGADVSVSSGPVVITGIGGQGGDGVSLQSSRVASSAAGAIDIRGRSGIVLAATGAAGEGVNAANSTLATVGAAGYIALSGESAGGSGIVLSGTNAIGAAGTNGNVVLRAFSTGQSAASPPMLSLGGTLRTTGVINIRPGGVSATGVPTEQPGTVINLGGLSAAGEFALAQAGLDGAVQAGSAGVIIGSSAQTGTINVTASGPLSGLYDLTLQNDGAGSGGINLVSGLSIPGRMLTLSSGASVTQGAAIVAGRLLLHGTRAQSNFQLANTGNAVARLSSLFELPKGPAATDGDVNFYSTGNLEIGPLTGVGFDGATGQAQSFVAANAVIAGDIVAQAGGNLTLQQNVSTLGSDITLVAGGVLLNPVSATLNPGGGGRWRVFADTWVGEVDGGLTGTAPTPNYYNCLYGTGCMSLLPAANNYFVYRQQPVLTIALTTPTQTRVYGTPNPLFPFTASGLVNGDTLAASAAGGYTVPAALNVGSYAVTGAFSSPVGYRIDAAPGTLNVTPAMLTYVANPASRDIGRPNPVLSGAVTGLVNGDTLAGAATGTLSFTSPATVSSPAGTYAINGSGLSAQNYVFQQAPSNLTALTLKPLYSLLLPSIGIDVSLPSSELYGANFGVQRSCVGSGPLAGASVGGNVNDTLAMEWSRVRETPNLSNCIGLVQRYTCGDF